MGSFMAIEAAKIETGRLMRYAEERIKRNPCKDCDYYISENNSCQSKKCATSGCGYVTQKDKKICEPYKEG